VQGGKGASFLVDYQLNLGVQMPLTIFWDRKIPMAPAKECPLQSSTRIPAAPTVSVTPTATACRLARPVPRHLRRHAGGQGRLPGAPHDADDADGDGVVNDKDKCPGTTSSSVALPSGVSLARSPGR